MSEVRRWKLKGFLPGVEGECKAVFQPTVVMAEDHDRVTAERDALRNEVGQVKGEYDRAVNKVDALQALLTAADERTDVLEGLLRRVSASCALTWEYHQPTADTLELQDLIDAALKPTEGGGDD